MLVLVIGIVYWTPMTRVIHGEVLSIREKEFVDAARLTGCTNRRILFRHILPHLVAPVIVYTSLGIATTHPLRGDAQLHRPRRAAADAVVGPDDLRRPELLPLRAAPGHLSRASRS